mmetsp:Transcript_37934/g.84509  ORF Transcript_37934/g.84509 Transcript_37934/m.84509 type:complete len:243 (-) Transcript_37934:1019-1747(-)
MNFHTRSNSCGGSRQYIHRKNWTYTSTDYENIVLKRPLSFCSIEPGLVAGLGAQSLVLGAAAAGALCASRASASREVTPRPIPDPGVAGPMVELRAVLGPAPEPAPDMAAVPEFMLLALALPAAYRVWPTGPLLAAGLAGSLLPAPSSWLLALQLLPPRGLLGVCLAGLLEYTWATGRDSASLWCTALPGPARDLGPGPADTGVPGAAAAWPLPCSCKAAILAASAGVAKHPPPCSGWSPYS